MSWILWAAVGILLGPTLVVLLPFVLGIIGDDDVRERMGGIYAKQAIHMLGSSVLVARNQGGLSLTSTDGDPKFDADHVSIGGEDGHLRDDIGVKGYLFNKEFGLSTEEIPYVTPLLAEFGWHASQASHEDRIGAQSDGGLRLDFELPEFSEAVDLRHAKRVLDGSASFRSGIVAEEKTQKSQEKFHKNLDVGQTIMLIMAFVAGGGLALGILKYGPSGGGGGGGVEMPIQVMAMAVGGLL